MRIVKYTALGIFAILLLTAALTALTTPATADDHCDSGHVGAVCDANDGTNTDTTTTDSDDARSDPNSVAGEDGCISGVCNDELATTFNQLSNFIIFLVAIVAFPNGAYGFLQILTAGNNPEKISKGKNRLKRTFFALGGVAALKFLVAYATMVTI